MHLSLAALVISLMDCTTPGTTSCSIPEYSPATRLRQQFHAITFSVFTDKHRINTIKRRFVPYNRLAGTHVCIEIKSTTQSQIQTDVALSNRRGQRTCSPSRQECRGIPFRATLFLLTDSMADSGILVLPCSITGVTSTSSQSIGMSAARKISTTEREISGPMPSPVGKGKRIHGADITSTRQIGGLTAIAHNTCLG